LGDQEDEGTIFSLTTLNVTTEAEVRSYVSNVFPGMSSSLSDQFLNMLSPQNKRVVSLFGDVVFQAPRRFMLNHTPDVSRYTFLSQQLKGLPIVGTFHANDITWQYLASGSGSLVYRNAFIAFGNNIMYINAVGLFTGKDNSRLAQMSFLNNNYQDIFVLV
ncbi:hypothetical protein BABINDRAFT_35652, partial [Babjeviella inositovora NRRL Y-12698]